MKLRSDTARIQELLGHYCKTAEPVDLPGVTEGRLHHYRRLVYKVIMSTMSQAFPICKSTLNEEEWDQLVNDFFSNHPCDSAQIWKLPYEFYHYHFSMGTGQKSGKPWLNDLLYFEWAEIDIHTMPDKEIGSFNDQGDPIKDRLVLNPEHELLQLSYPVHLYAVNEVEANKGEYYVLLFREPETGNVKFLNLSVLHAYILANIGEHKQAIDSFKGEIARIAQVESQKYLDDYLIGFVQDLRDRQMVLGFSSEK